MCINLDQYFFFHTVNEKGVPDFHHVPAYIVFKDMQF